jgi:mitogen-activated protein kinase kinase kinase 11
MEFPRKKDLPSSFMISCSDPNRYYTPQVTTSHKAFTPMTPPTRLAGKQASPIILEEEYPEQNRSASLLNLLACLVRLKESTGMQRATISSMMGIESQILVTSLLLEVENQRKLVAELQNLPLFDDSLQTLVRDSVKMSSEMEALQLKIIRDFDLEGFQLKIQSLNVWNMMTVYIDKLYALELLLVEELEFCQEDAGAQVACARTGQNQEDGLVVLEKIFGDKHIAELPPDVVKRKLIEYVGQQDESVPPPPPPSLMSELLLTESSSAPQLASEANKRGESLLSGMLQFPAASVESSKEWQINLDELQFRKRIGRGNAGTTYLAQWSGQTVAAKVAALSEMGLDGWKAEVQTLQRLHHPNVIRLLGSVYNENPLTYCLVLEYCNAGDLSNALQSPTPPDFFNRVATDVANGMAYLHKRGVLHRDIKPSNVLLDGNVHAGVFTSKVSDLGVATSYDEADPNRTAETGTYRWMAPEVIRHESYSLMADVYSFAILCWQLLTRENPFANVSPIEAAGKVALEQARPPFPEGTPPALRNLISTCWAEDPSARLTFEEISTRLGELQLTEEETLWLRAPMGHAVYDQRQVKARATAQLQVPSVRPPLDDHPRRPSGFRKLFPKHKR